MSATPHDIAAEQALLGGVMQRPDALHDLAALVQPDSFYRPDHGKLLAVMLDMDRRGERIDRVTISGRILNAPGWGDDDFAYALALPEKCPSTANLEHYALRVRDLSMRRRLIADMAALGEQAADSGVPVADLQARVMLAASSLDGGTMPDDWMFYDEATNRGIALTERAARGEGMAGVPFPWLVYPGTSRDPLIEVLPFGELHVVGARPAMGKSAMARGIAESTSGLPPDEEGLRWGVGIFSLEMTPEQMAQMSIAGMGGVNAYDVRSGRLDQEAWDGVEFARRMLSSLPIAVCRTSTLTVEDIEARSRALAKAMRKRGARLRLVVIDYLQLVSASRHLATANPNDRVTHITRSLKLMAKALDVAVVCLSQLNRKVEERSDKRPTMADLRDSGSIEQDACTVIFPFRPGVYDKNAREDEALLIVGKNRYGSPGEGPMRWEGRYARFALPDSAPMPDWDAVG